MAQLPLQGNDLRHALERIVDLVGEAIGDGSGRPAVSLCLGSPTRPVQTVSNGKAAQEVDGAQMTAGEGPSHDAWRSGGVVVADGDEADRRWPAFRSRADHLPIRALAAVPLPGPEQPAGVLCACFLDGTDVEGRLDALRLLAEAAATVLALIEQNARAGAELAQLREALESRAVIDQAKGIVMARDGCTADEAFAKLARLSSDSNVKLRTIATDLVDGVRRDGGSARE